MENRSSSGVAPSSKQEHVEEVAKNVISLIQKNLEKNNAGSSNAEATTVNPQRSSVASEMQRSFPGFHKGKQRFVPGPLKSIKRQSLQVYLLSSAAKVSPTTDDDLMYSQAGLGMKIISFPEDASHEQISQELGIEFPKLPSLKGAWLFYKASGGGGRRKLCVISPQADGYTTPYLKRASNGGKNTLYIAPIQGELDITPLEKNAVEFSKMPKASCEICQEAMPLHLLPLHAVNCNSTGNEDSQVEYIDDTPAALTTSKDLLPTPTTTYQATAEKVPCPVCNEIFDLDTVESHASFCVERVFGERTDEVQEVWESSGPSTSENWKNSKDPHKAILLFTQEILHRKNSQPANRLTVDLRRNQEEQDRSYMCFYKNPRVEWASPLSCTLSGDAAVGLGVNRHVMSSLMFRLRTGFYINVGNGPVTRIFEGQMDHLVPSNSAVMLEGELFQMAGRMLGHCFLYGGPGFPGLSPAIKHVLCGGSSETAVISIEDCPDLDIRDTIELLKKTDVSEEERQQLLNLCLAWDFPLPSKENINWLHEKLLIRAVLGRASKQLKQIRKGLKETGIWPILCEREDVARCFFPTEAEAEITAEVILSRILWPCQSVDSDSDDEDASSADEITRICDFLKTYINEASSEKRKQLLKFWVGWEVTPATLIVKVTSGKLPRAFTCFDTIKLPTHYFTYEEFKSDLEAVTATCETGFGLP